MSEGGEGAPRRDRLEIIVPVGLACAVYSYGYTIWSLPPQIPFGTVGLMLGGDLLPMLVVPALVVRFVLGRPLREFGWKWPGWGPGAISAGGAWLAMLPLLFVFAQRPEFQAAYPSPEFPPARQHWIGLAFLWGLHHLPQLLSTEFLMRGFLFLPLARVRGFVPAVLVVGLPYVVLHADKPPLEMFQAAWGALVFGWAAWRTRSFLPAFVAHLAVAVSMDLLCLGFSRGAP